MTGLLTSIAFIQAKKSDLRSDVKDAVVKATAIVKEEVKKSIQGQAAEPRSIDTREFLNSVDSSVEDNQGIVYSDVEQGAFMEFGTSKIPERRHFRNSLNRNKDKINRIMKQSI